MKWPSSFDKLRSRASSRLVLLVLYYFVVQLALFAMYAYKDFEAPSYIYQEF